MTSPGGAVPVAQTVITVRTPELDSFGHVNHAVFLNYLEHARFLALEEAGFAWSSLDEEGWQIFVVRIEVDYLAEANRGQELLIRTWAESFRRTTMVLGQEIVRADDPNRVVTRACVTAVWIGPGGRPMRVPEHVRVGLSSGTRKG
ncbi:MAG: acyl-CoA thioesterase [Gemmatimonadota bacterium]|nr:acyl-CoA thioesterase [Gemmatimonadota bacterium]MDH3421661.1 acyl-CoA thioesterase [Gemmatimonadota bacterium]